MSHKVSEYFMSLEYLLAFLQDPDATSTPAVQQSEPVNMDEIDEIVRDLEQSIDNSAATPGTSGLSSPSQPCISSSETVQQLDTDREVEAVASTSRAIASEGSVSPPDHLGRYMEILIHPKKSRRFRYDSDINSAGPILGENSTDTVKSFPKIKIPEHDGEVEITVSCVCKDKPYRVHPNGVVGKKKKSAKDSSFIYVKKVPITREDCEISFNDLGIRTVRANQVKEALQLRKIQRVDPFGQGFNHNIKRSELREVRLCFQVKFAEGDTLPPVISNVITDEKKLGSLQIKKMYACCIDKKGGSEITIIGKQLNPKDLEVYFYEIEKGKKVWEQCVRSSEFEAYERSAIVCKSPAYSRAGVEPDAEVTVNVVLRRVSDGHCGNIQSLTYRPEITDILKNKKRKTNDLIHQPVREVLTPPATLPPDYAAQHGQDWRKMQGSLDDNPGLPATSIANAGVSASSTANAGVPASISANVAVTATSFADAAMSTSSFANAAVPASNFANADVSRPIYINTAMPATNFTNSGVSASSFANADVSSSIYLNTASSSAYATVTGPNRVNSDLLGPNQVNSAVPSPSVLEPMQTNIPKSPVMEAVPAITQPTSVSEDEGFFSPGVTVSAKDDSETTI